MMSGNDLSTQFKALYDDWGNAVVAKRFEWLDTHIADDFLGTSQPFPAISISKPKLIALSKGLETVEARWIEVTARSFGQMVLTLAVRQFDKIIHKPGVSAGGPGAPSPSQLAAFVSGKRVLYVGAWRQRGEVWEMFDNHMTGIVGHAER
jgi:hypothetical protein